MLGRWGLISAMTKADGLDKVGKLSTFNARSETAPKSFTFGNAWRRAQHCIVSADAIFEPDWRSGAAGATRFIRADGAPLGIAGLWDRWRDAAGQVQERLPPSGQGKAHDRKPPLSTTSFAREWRRARAWS
nr:SOS response-associated peptidase family protein [Achromobacter sp. LC458]